MEKRQPNNEENFILNKDHQRNTATVSLKRDSPLVAIVNEGDAQAFQLPEYGELKVRVLGGKISLITISENHKY